MRFRDEQRTHYKAVYKCPVYCLQLNSISLSSSLAGRRPVHHQIPLHYPACDQLARRSATSSRAGSRASSRDTSSWTKTCVFTSCACRTPNSITMSSSLAGRRPVRDQIPLRCPACDQLVSRSATSSRARYRSEIWPEPVCDQVRAISTCRDSLNLSVTCRKPSLRPGLRHGKHNGI